MQAKGFGAHRPSTVLHPNEVSGTGDDVSVESTRSIHSIKADRQECLSYENVFYVRNVKNVSNVTCLAAAQRAKADERSIIDSPSTNSGFTAW